MDEVEEVLPPYRTEPLPVDRPSDAGAKSWVPKGEPEEDELPVGSYALLAGLHAADFAAVLALMRRLGKPLPERIGAADLALLGVAAHKISRLLAKGTITRFLRYPFTEVKGPAGYSELKEKPVGTGLRKALGQLVSCPFCAGMWVASALTYGLLLAPRPTRLIAGMAVITAVSDFLQLAYTAAEKGVQVIGKPVPR